MVAIPHDPGDPADAYRAGVADERARGLRIFDDELAGVVVDDDLKARLARIVERIRSGRDVRS